MTGALVDIFLGRVIFAIRVIVAVVDNIATQLLIMLLDTVIISWAKILATSGGEIAHKILKVIGIIIIIKYILVFTVIIGYGIVVVGDWDVGLSLGWTVSFSTSVFLSAVTFWSLFVVMSRKTTQLLGDSTSETVVEVHKKVRYLIDC